MISSIPRHVATAATILLLGSTAFRGAAAQAAEPAASKGELWEVTSKMSMEGAPIEFPANKSKVCAAREWAEPPGAADERRKCTNSDFKMDGPKATWKTTCAGPPAMTGEGEITRDGSDAYTGAIKFVSSEGNLTIKLDGRRLGECDLRQAGR